MKKVNTLLTLVMLAVGGYIGFISDLTTTTTAHEVIVPRFTDVPRQSQATFDINLNNNTVSADGIEQNVVVTIRKQDSIIYRTKTKTVEKPVYVKVRETAPMRKKTVSCTNVLKTEMPKSLSIAN
jgi:phosphoenolpyruvate-protein kinase (PTS system EI component)